MIPSVIRVVVMIVEYPLLSRKKLVRIMVLMLLVMVLGHVTRNLSSFYFLMYFSLVFVIVFLSVNKRKIRVNNPPIFLLYTLFLVFSLWVSYWSFIFDPNVSFALTLSRLFFVTLIPLILIMVELKDKDFETALKLFVLVVVVGSLSYFYQYFFGAISWFNNVGEPRGGLVRFSSSLGSLTTYGVAVGIALYATYAVSFNKKTKFIIFIILLLGALLSMQKAALLNAVIAFIFIFISFKYKVNLILYILLFLLVLIVFSFLYQNSFLSEYLQAFVLNTLGVNLFDNINLVKTEQISPDLLFERFTGLHFLEIIEKHGALLLFISGIGATGAGGAMGVDSLQAHNSFWDLYFMGGFFYLFTFLLFYFFIQFTLYKINSNISKVFFILNFIFLLNAFSASIIMFHPVTSFCFWVSVLYILKRNKFNYKLPGQGVKYGQE